MTNYTEVDLRIDYKKETGNCNMPGQYRHTDEYLLWLEEQVIKYHNEERQITHMNIEIADAMNEEQSCDCGCERMS